MNFKEFPRMEKTTSFDKDVFNSLIEKAKLSDMEELVEISNGLASKQIEQEKEVNENEIKMEIEAIVRWVSEKIDWEKNHEPKEYDDIRTVGRAAFPPSDEFYAIFEKLQKIFKVSSKSFEHEEDQAFEGNPNIISKKESFTTGIDRLIVRQITRNTASGETSKGDAFLKAMEFQYLSPENWEKVKEKINQ